MPWWSVLEARDVRPWQLLADGTIVGLERDARDEVRVAIDHVRLRVKFADGGTAFVLRLVDCSDVVYHPHDEPPIAVLATIAASEPDILTPPVDDGVVRVRGRAGDLVLRYRALAIELDTGRALAIDELAAAVT